MHASENRYFALPVQSARRSLGERHISIFTTRNVIVTFGVGVGGWTHDVSKSKR